MGDEKALTQAQTEALTMSVGDTGFTMSGLAEVFVQSGFFAKDVKSQSQAIVKILYGRELGLSPIKAMLGIYMVEGRPEVAAAILGGILKRSGRYDYREKELNATSCAIEFYSIGDGDERLIGTAKFTMEDAARAGLANKFNWKSYPEDMLWARALARGIRRYCPDAIGVPVYVQGEISDSIAAGNGIPARVIDKATGEVLDPPHEEENEYLPKAKESEQVMTIADAQAQGHLASLKTTAPEPAKRGPGRPRKEAVTGGPSIDGSAIARAESTAAPAPSSPDPAPEWIEFTLGEGTFMRSYRTRGMTAVQMAESHKLLKQVDTLCGNGTARAILAKQMNVQVEDATRNALTEAEADKFLAALRATLGEKA